MKPVRAICVLVFALLAMLFMTGCATYKTISSADTNSAKVFSGTRLDVMAMTGTSPHTRKFKVGPPEYPVLDLPFSVVLDTMIFPSTLSVATYECVFEQ